MSWRPAIDLALFSVDHSVLGRPLSPSDAFHAHFESSDVLDLPDDGIEVGTADSLLDYAVVTIDAFKGRFFVHGSQVVLARRHTPLDIEAKFGAPYWTDRSDDEILLFYEYRRGTVELQFEFSDAIHLSHVSMMRNGVLSGKTQREYYRVTAPWPPDVDEPLRR